MTATAEIQNASSVECHAPTSEVAMLAEATFGGYSPFDGINNARAASLGTKGCSAAAQEAAQQIIMNIAQGANVTINVNSHDERMAAALAQYQLDTGVEPTAGANLSALAPQRDSGRGNGIS